MAQNGENLLEALRGMDAAEASRDLALAKGDQNLADMYQWEADVQQALFFILEPTEATPD